MYYSNLMDQIDLCQGGRYVFDRLYSRNIDTAEAGKNADLLILNKRPLEDIGVLSEPGVLHKIFKYGEEVK